MNKIIQTVAFTAVVAGIAGWVAGSMAYYPMGVSQGERNAAELSRAHYVQSIYAKSQYAQGQVSNRGYELD